MEISTLKLPLSKLCPVPLALQNRAFFDGGEMGEKGAEKRGGRGATRKRVKRKKGRVKTGQEVNSQINKTCIIILGPIVHLKPRHVNMVIPSAQCCLDGASSV